MKNLLKVLFISVLLFSTKSVSAKDIDVEKVMNEFFKDISKKSDKEINLEKEINDLINGDSKNKSANKHHESAEEVEEKAGFDPVHHVMDAHDIHLWGEGHESVSLPLPILLWTENGLVTFISTEFEHKDDGTVIVTKNGMNFVKMHEKIYQLNSGEHELHLNHETHTPENAIMPLDFSITKVVVAIFLVAFIMIFVFKASAKKYKTNQPEAPKGIASWTEPLVLFVRDFAKENIGDANYMRFMPYLLTVFFFIWFGNLLGLIPFIGGINMTGNISITLTLAMFTLFIQIVHSKWAFWKHMLMPPGVPWPIWFILVPIELIGVLIKPAALTIRLFANITAGHIIVLSIIGIIFTTHNIGWAGLSVPLALFISVLEVTLVAFLQAFIFTMLSAMFIGAAVDDGHH